MKFEEVKCGDIFEVFYSEGFFYCPLCGFANSTNYELEDLSSCENCNAEFEGINVVRVLTKGNNLVKERERRMWKLEKNEY